MPARDGLRPCLAVAAVSFAALVPLDYIWFKLDRGKDALQRSVIQHGRQAHPRTAAGIAMGAASMAVIKDDALVDSCLARFIAERQDG